MLSVGLLAEERRVGWLEDGLGTLISPGFEHPCETKDGSISAEYAVKELLFVPRFVGWDVSPDLLVSKSSGCLRHSQVPSTQQPPASHAPESNQRDRWRDKVGATSAREWGCQ